MPGLQSIERPTGDHWLKEAGDTTTCMYYVLYTVYIVIAYIYIYILGKSKRVCFAFVCTVYA